MGKTLSEMSLEELWELFPIFLTEYQEEWELWYREEAENLKNAFLDETVKISHIASTAIKGIWAKPIVDILMEVPVTENLLSYTEKIENYGYLCMNESSNRISFNKGYTENGFARKVFHLHLRYCADNAEYNYELYFHWYNLIHELGHIIIMFNSVSHPHPAAEEQLVNNFAVACWQHYGE